jgi:DNA helicase IV
MIAQLQQQLKAYPNELLGVACPRNADVDACLKALAESPLADRVLRPKDLQDRESDRVIFVSTVYDIKGLEFRAMHLIATEKITTARAAQKRVAFTAVTRAKTRLSVWWTKSIPPYMEQAAEAVSVSKAPPAISDLFPSSRS